MPAVQLLLFPEIEKSEVQLLRDEVERLQQTCDKVRKGQYAKLGDTTKLILEIKYELETLKRDMIRYTQTKGEI